MFKRSTALVTGSNSGIGGIAALTTFLAGREAASITGAIIPVDGGWTAP